jgi:hypothetical protein
MPTETGVHCVVPCRLQLLAEYQSGLLASLQLLGLAVPDLAGCLEALKSLALARAGLTQPEVSQPTQLWSARQSWRVHKCWKSPRVTGSCGRNSTRV